MLARLELYMRAMYATLRNIRPFLLLLPKQEKQAKMTIPDEVDIIVTGGGSCGFVFTCSRSETITDAAQMCCCWPSGQSGP